MKREVYRINNEQRKVSRCFFVKNGKSLTIGVILGVFGCFLMGLHYWHNRRNAAIAAASRDWWQLVNTDLSGQAGQSQLDTARYFADANDNNYGALTSLGLAQQYVKQGDFAAAQMHLQKALSQTHEANLQSIINLRLARVQLQQKNFDGALKTLNGIKEKGWMELVEDTRGDVQIVKGDYQAAHAAYEKALQSGTQQALVRMKLNNLYS